MQQDDLVDLYFPGQKDTGFPAFVRLLSGENGTQAALFVTDASTKQWDDTIAGFITWSPMPLGASSAIVAGFIFFKRFQGTGTTDASAHAAFEHWFTKTSTEMVLGVCPSRHTLAMRYNQRIGLHEVGRLPNSHLFQGQPCDAVLYALTKQQWEAK